MFALHCAHNYRASRSCFIKSLLLLLSLSSSSLSSSLSSLLAWSTSSSLSSLYSFQYALRILIKDINGSQLTTRRFLNHKSRLLLQPHTRPVPTTWETSRKISFPSYYYIHVVQILSFKMIHIRVAVWFGVQTYYFLEKFLCFLLISKMFSEPYLP